MRGSLKDAPRRCTQKSFKTKSSPHRHAHFSLGGRHTVQRTPLYSVRKFQHAVRTFTASSDLTVLTRMTVRNTQESHCCWAFCDSIVRAQSMLVLSSLSYYIMGFTTISQSKFGSELSQIKDEMRGYPGLDPNRALGYLWTMPDNVNSDRGLGGGIAFA